MDRAQAGENRPIALGRFITDYPPPSMKSLWYSLILALFLAPAACSKYDPCGDKKCGDACRICDPDDSSCVETAEVKACNRNLVCTSATGSVCE